MKTKCVTKSSISQQKAVNLWRPCFLVLQYHLGTRVAKSPAQEADLQQDASSKRRYLIQAYTLHLTKKSPWLAQGLASMNKHF